MFSGLELAMARTATGLMRDAETRELTDGERRFLAAVAPLLKRIEAERAAPAQAANGGGRDEGRTR